MHENVEPTMSKTRFYKERICEKWKRVTEAVKKQWIIKEYIFYLIYNY